MKKSQGAAEFLMTYSWVILVLAVLLIALNYMGVINAKTLLPETYKGPNGLDCISKASVQNNAIGFVVRNNNGYNINIHDTDNAVPLTISSNDCTLVSADVYCLDSDSSGPATECSANNDENIKVELTCAQPIQEGEFKGNVQLPFENTQTGLAHSATIVIKARS